MSESDMLRPVKVCQGNGGWQFCLRVADEFGVPVEGLGYETGR